MKGQVCDLPVMKKICKTCPFKLDKHGRYQDVELVNAIITRTLFKAQQICHSTEGKRRKANNRCKGAYDYNFEIYKRLGLEKLLK